MNNPRYEKWVCIYHHKDKYMPVNSYYQGRQKLTIYLDRLTAIDKCIALNKLLPVDSEFKYSPQRFYDEESEKADNIKNIQEERRLARRRVSGF
ncbi:TPA: hypothetical protein ACSUN1_003110 [Salmonella enterica subsp. diarizonae]